MQVGLELLSPQGSEFPGPSTTVEEVCALWQHIGFKRRSCRVGQVTDLALRFSYCSRVVALGSSQSWNEGCVSLSWATRTECHRLGNLC